MVAPDPQRLRVKMVDVGNLDLKVHSSPERVFQGSHTKPASGSICLFEHQMDGSARKISEPLLGPFKADAKSKSVNVEAQGSAQIGNVEFGNDWRCSEHAAMYQIRSEPLTPHRQSVPRLRPPL